LSNNVSKVNLDDIKTVEMPKGIQKTALQRTSEEYQRLKKEDKLNPDGTIKNVQIPQQQPAKEKSPQDEIKEYLAMKTDYNVLLAGEIVNFKRIDLNPLEYEQLMELIDFHTRMVSEIQSLERRRILYQAKLNIIQNSLASSIQKIDEYDEILQQIDALQVRYRDLSWTYNDRKFESPHQFNTYLYQKTLEFCLQMDEDDFNKSAMRGNSNIAKEKDVWGTKQIAEACIDVELHTYAYFQKPSKSSSES
jgi:hypothetical protein